jgi:hypothetical protein
MKSFAAADPGPKMRLFVTVTVAIAAMPLPAATPRMPTPAPFTQEAGTVTVMLPQPAVLLSTMTATLVTASAAKPKPAMIGATVAVGLHAALKVHPLWISSVEPMTSLDATNRTGPVDVTSVNVNVEPLITLTRLVVVTPSLPMAQPAMV